MQEISRAVYLEDVLFGKFDSPQRQEILSLSETSIRLEVEELAKFLNSHLETRMFLVGHSITAADLIAHAHLADYFAALADYEKLQLPNTFRWIDHVQHLPGLFEEV
jgi:glutathione S-transferase